MHWKTFNHFINKLLLFLAADIAFVFLIQHSARAAAMERQIDSIVDPLTTTDGYRFRPNQVGQDNKNKDDDQVHYPRS